MSGRLGGCDAAPGGALWMGGGAGAMCNAFEGRGGGWLVTGGG